MEKADVMVGLDDSCRRDLETNGAGDEDRYLPLLDDCELH